MKPALALAAAILLAGAADAPAVDIPRVDAERLRAETPAPTLAAYGLFTDKSGRQPAPGVEPYTLNTPLFSDHAEKQRYVFLPPGTAARYTPTGVLDFPVGTTLVKSFAYPADFRQPARNVRLIETRLLVRRTTGWVPLSYVWNERQTEAVLKRAGTRLPVTFIDANGTPQQLDYAVPNINQCKQCHLQGTEATPIGPTAANLNGPLKGHGANQLQSWAATNRLTGLRQNAPRLARWDDPSAPLAQRARAYLDVNCGHCHSRAGFASNSGLYLQHDEASPAHQGINKRPIAAGRGSGGREFSIKPGDPEASILVHRMESSEPGVMMPQFGRTVTHAEGIALVRAYVAAMR